VFVFNKNSYEKLDISLDKFFFENEGSVAKYDVPEDFFPKSNEQALTITMDVNENIYPTKKYFYSTITIPESYSL